MKLVSLFLLASILTPLCLCFKFDNKAVLIDVINNFVLEQKRLSTLTGFLCWSSSEIIGLIKTLNANGFSSKVYLLNDANTHKKAANFIHDVYLLDMNCPAAKIFLDNNANLLKAPYRWLLLSDNEHMPPPPAYVPLSSRVYLLKASNGNNNNYTLDSVYQVAPQRPYIYQKVAVWNANRFLYYNALGDERNRSNLHMVTLNVSIVMLYPDSIKYALDFRYPGKDAPFKYNYAICNSMLDVINITRNVKFFKHWGGYDPKTKTFTGKMGSYQRGESDIAASPLFLTANRFAFLEYYLPTPTKAAFAFLTPPMSYVYNVFALPFNSVVWLSTLFLFLLMVCTFGYILNWEWTNPHFHANNNESEAAAHVALASIQIGFGNVCQQGVEFQPKSISGKMITYTFLLSFMFLYIAYSANIISILQATTDSIKTLQDLINSKIEVGVADTPYFRVYFPLETGKFQQELYKTKIQSKDSWQGFEDGMNRIRSGFFAFHDEISNIFKYAIDHFEDSGLCRMKYIHFLSVVDPHIPIKKGSPYKEIFKVKFAKLEERGLTKRYRKRIFTYKLPCEQQASNYISISLLDSYFAFLLLGIGISIALLFLVVELYYYYNYRKISNNTIKANILTKMRRNIIFDKSK